MASYPSNGSSACLRAMRACGNRRCHSGRCQGVSGAAIPHHHLIGIILAVVIGVSLITQTALGFVLGAVLSGQGFIGMNVSVRSNVRVLLKPRSGINAALAVAFRGWCHYQHAGGRSGPAGRSRVLLVPDRYRAAQRQPDEGRSALADQAADRLRLRLIADLDLRASGWRHLHQGADVGADLVGKVEAGIPEDDPAIRP